MATIYDVAEAAGVSISTVSHVLNETRFVSENTRAKVLEAVTRLNYHPSSLARALVRQETRTIGLIVPDNVNPFFAELARGIENHGFQAGYSVILCNSDRSTSKELAYLETLLSKRVDGVIYMTTDMATDRLMPFHEEGIPIVTFDRDYDNIDSILLDNFQGGYDATRHLLELGHTRIGCIAGPDSPSRSSDRVRGYRAALEEAHIPYNPDLLCVGDWTARSGQVAASEFLRLPVPPTAIFSCNDMMAVGAIAFLRDRGCHVPQDISVIGYDNISLSAYVCPPLTTIATPIEQIGQGLCQMLLDCIGEKLPAETQRVTVRGALLVRESTAQVT
ncbi:MAG: LacI family DNA-binding transcriptional regulator [Chloroflexi bacterium]|nr:LacI family DNA-binding transcriptional regulator [Chloroflexota bacterium]